MSPSPAYNQVDNWSSLLQLVSSCPREELEQHRAFADKTLKSSKDVGWALPLGYALYRLELYKEALNVLEMAEVFADTDTEYNMIMGMSARKIPGKKEIAKQAYSRALKISPYRADIFYNLGNLMRDESPKIAERAYRFSLLIDNTAYLTWHNLGISLNEQDKFYEALKAFRQGIKINPMHADGWCNAGLSLFGMEQFKRAIKYFHCTLQIDEKSEPGHVNLGYALMNDRRPYEALDYLKKGLSLNQGSVNSVWNLSLIHLMLGNYIEGWDLYEARFGTDQFKDHVWPSSGVRITAFSELKVTKDNPLLVWSEQGMGDVIQFCRYLYLLEEKDIPFVFSTRKNLIELMKTWLPFSDKIILEKTWTPEEDNRPQIPLMSLPRLFGTETHTIPNHCPYLTPTKKIPDRLLLNEAPGGLKVGFAWASNPDNKQMYRHKTMPPELLLSHFIDLVDLDLIDLHSLQIGKDSKNIEQYKDHQRVYNWDGKLDDFSDTAFVINQLDMVISVDTAVAHLGGALGKPTWLLLPHNADFRWLLDSTDSPWYPTMRIFRQPQRGDWEFVAKEIKEALGMLFALDLDSLSNSKLK